MTGRAAHQFTITENTSPRTLRRWMRRGGKPVDRDGRPINMDEAADRHVHPRHKRRKTGWK